MEFEELFEKYQKGTATDEEKAFVEAEMAKADSEIGEDAPSAPSMMTIVPAGADELHKAKKKFRIRAALIGTVSAAICLIVILGAVLGGVFGYAASSAKKHSHVSRTQADVLALEYVDNMIDRDYPAFADCNLSIKDTDKHLEVESKLGESRYVYFIEMKTTELADGRYLEVEVKVNTRNYEVTVVDIDRED